METTYTIYAGVNGAGKSTLYKAIPKPSGIRINPDEIAAGIGHWSIVENQLKAGRIAVSMIKDCIEHRKSFCQETTLSGNSVIRNINKAKEKGFKINLYYVGLESAELAKSRVEQRVSEGGHGIDPHLIEKRYDISLENLKKIFPSCDNIKVYDNTSSLRLILDIRDGIVKKNISTKWLDPIINEYLGHARKKEEHPKSIAEWKDAMLRSQDKTLEKDLLESGYIIHDMEASAGEQGARQTSMSEWKEKIPKAGAEIKRADLPASEKRAGREASNHRD